MWYSCSVALDCWFEDFPIVGAIALSNRIRIEPLPTWVQTEIALKYLSWQDRRRIEGARLVLSSEYEAAALGSPDPTWTGKVPRGIQSVIAEEFALASACLWLAKPTRMTCGPLLHFSEKGAPDSLREMGSLRPTLITEEEESNQLDSETVELARTLLAAALTMPRDGTIWTAIRMLIRALTENLWEGRYVWHWIVLEALFGPNNPSETTFRLSQRITLFLRGVSDSAPDLFREIKENYSWRSKIVHGRELLSLTEAESRRLMKFTEDTVRAAITKVLTDPVHLQTFNSKRRDKWLEELVFSPERVQ